MPNKGDPNQSLAIHNRKVRIPNGLESGEFAAGDVIFREGDLGDRLYIVKSGLVQISKRAPKGDLPIGFVGGGEVFGELALIDGESRMGTATAVMDVECVTMSADHFRRLRDGADPFFMDLLVVLSRGMRSLAVDWLQHHGAT